MKISDDSYWMFMVGAWLLLAAIAPNRTESVGALVSSQVWLVG